jgi:hypothetical protein
MTLAEETYRQRTTSTAGDRRALRQKIEALELKILIVIRVWRDLEIRGETLAPLTGGGLLARLRDLEDDRREAQEREDRACAELRTLREQIVDETTRSATSPKPKVSRTRGRSRRAGKSPA